ncbi:MAG: hypothetical protein E3J72_17325 [Planctomycetota bacterium]|nr:MAG: hypothetical protein E3J72_17325 [Planctomycetota bacterium]
MGQQDKLLSEQYLGWIRNQLPYAVMCADATRDRDVMALAYKKGFGRINLGNGNDVYAQEYYKDYIAEYNDDQFITNRTLDGFLLLIGSYREAFEIFSYQKVIDKIFKKDLKTLFKDFSTKLAWRDRAKYWQDLDIKYPHDMQKYKLCQRLRNAVAHGNNDEITDAGEAIYKHFKIYGRFNVGAPEPRIDTNTFHFVTHFWIECIEYLRDEIKNVHEIDV